MLPAVVAVFLMLIFLVVNQAIISNETSKNVAKVANSSTNNAPVLQAISVDNDNRGAHSYFPAPRLFSARYSTNTPLAASEPKEQSEKFSNPPISQIIQVLPMTVNAQDLLRSGYLRDNEAVYVSAFGAARSQ